MLTVLETQVSHKPASLNVLPATVPCPTCNVACCREYVVTVTGYDAWLLARNLHLGLEQFLVCGHASNDGMGEYFKLDHSPDYWGIALAKKTEEREAGWCSFWLSFDGGHGRCGVYRDRPLVCRTYPFNLNKGQVRVRDNAMCPKDSWRLAHADVEPQIAALVRFEIERAIYYYVVSVWNHYVSSCPPSVTFPAGVYFGYLLEVYDRLDEILAPMRRGDAPVLMDHWRECMALEVNPLDCLAGESEDRAVAEILRSVQTAVDSFQTLAYT